MSTNLQLFLILLSSLLMLYALEANVLYAQAQSIQPHKSKVSKSTIKNKTRLVKDLTSRTILKYLSSHSQSNQVHFDFNKQSTKELINSAFKGNLKTSFKKSIRKKIKGRTIGQTIVIRPIQIKKKNFILNRAHMHKSYIKVAILKKYQR